MATLTIKNVPDDLYARLKDAASRHRRSINSEAIVCLERTLGADTVDPDQFLAGARLLRERASAVYVTDAELQRAKEEGRP